MLKLFISQPMKGRTDEEILKERERIISMVEASYGTIQVIDSFIKEEAPTGVNASLWYLARSIKFLSEADIAYFASGWWNARGCKIEHECAEVYGVRIIEEED